MRCLRTSLMVLGLAGAVAAQAQSVPPDAPEAASPAVARHLEAKNPLLLALFSPFFQSASISLSASVGGLFQRLFMSHSAPNSEAGQTQVPGHSASSMPGKVAAVADAIPFNESLQPSLLMGIEQLDPDRFTPVRSLAQSAEPPHLRTGDVFAISFASNVPGRITVENSDSAAVHSVVASYTILPGQDNRFPPRRGIQLVGATGLETFEVLFQPCIPDIASALPQLATFKGRLPACREEDKDLPLSTPVRGRAIKSAINLDVGDPLIAARVLPNFRASDVIRTQFLLQHDP